jgi:hypothetical protein
MSKEGSFNLIKTLKFLFLTLTIFLILGNGFAEMPEPTIKLDFDNGFLLPENIELLGNPNCNIQRGTGKACLFDGIDDKIVIQNQNLENFTLSFIIKFSNDQESTILEFENGKLLLNLNTKKKQLSFIDKDDIGINYLVTPIEKGIHYIVITKKENKFTLYLNGRLIGDLEKILTSKNIKFSSNVIINYFKGGLDEILFWNKAYEGNQLINILKEIGSEIKYNELCPNVNEIYNQKTQKCQIFNIKECRDCIQELELGKITSDKIQNIDVFYNTSLRNIGRDQKNNVNYIEKTIKNSTGTYELPIELTSDEFAFYKESNTLFNNGDIFFNLNEHERYELKLTSSNVQILKNNGTGLYGEAILKERTPYIFQDNINYFLLYRKGFGVYIFDVTNFVKGNVALNLEHFKREDGILTQTVKNGIATSVTATTEACGEFDSINNQLVFYPNKMTADTCEINIPEMKNIFYELKDDDGDTWKFKIQKFRLQKENSEYILQLYSGDDFKTIDCDTEGITTLLLSGWTGTCTRLSSSCDFDLTNSYLNDICIFKTPSNKLTWDGSEYIKIAKITEIGSNKIIFSLIDSDTDLKIQSTSTAITNIKTEAAIINTSSEDYILKECDGACRRNLKIHVVGSSSGEFQAIETTTDGMLHLHEINNGSAGNLKLENLRTLENWFKYMGTANTKTYAENTEINGYTFNIKNTNEITATKEAFNISQKIDISKKFYLFIHENNKFMITLGEEKYVVAKINPNATEIESILTKAGISTALNTCNAKLTTDPITDFTNLKNATLNSGKSISFDTYKIYLSHNATENIIGISDQELRSCKITELPKTIGETKKYILTNIGKNPNVTKYLILKHTGSSLTIKIAEQKQTIYAKVIDRILEQIKEALGKVKALEPNNIENSLIKGRWTELTTEFANKFTVKNNCPNKATIKVEGNDKDICYANKIILKDFENKNLNNMNFERKQENTIKINNEIKHMEENKSYYYFSTNKHYFVFNRGDQIQVYEIKVSI